MLLTQAELQSLIEIKRRTPHELLGMHPLADGTGVAVRALVPDAAKVEVQPVHEKDKPAFKMTRLHKAGLFEGDPHPLFIRFHHRSNPRGKDIRPIFPPLTFSPKSAIIRWSDGGFSTP